MSQEVQNFWRSVEMLFNEILPLALVSAIVSIVDYLQRHYGIEPFRMSKFLIGLFTDIVYGTLVGLAAIGVGKSRFLAWALAGCAVHFGLRKLEKTVNSYLNKRYGDKK